MVEDCMYCGQDRDPCQDEAQMVRRGGSCAEAQQTLRIAGLRSLAMTKAREPIMAMDEQQLVEYIGDYGGYQDGRVSQPTDGWTPESERPQPSGWEGGAVPPSTDGWGQ